MNDHEHKVSFYDSYDSGSWLQSASSVEGSSWSDDDGQRFSFCPECGVSLAEFWQQIDSAREAHRQQLDRDLEQEQAERAREDVYRNTPPY